MKKILLVMLCLVMAFAFAACVQAEAPDTNGDDLETQDPVSESDWEYVQDKGNLVIGITIFNPMNYYDDQENLIGFDTELAEAVCAILGVEPVFEEINWDTKEIELASKGIDCIWNGLTIDEELNMDFSLPYVENKQSAVIDSANAEAYIELASMADAVIVAESGSAGEKAVAAEEALANADYNAVDKQVTALLEVKMGTADVAVVDYVMARGTLAAGGDYADLMIIPELAIGGEDYMEEYGIGFRLGSDLTEMINDALLDLVADGTIAVLAEKYGLNELLLLQ